MSHYYVKQVLGLPRTATKQDIKKRYFELAKKYHPDRNKGDKDAQKKFVEVTAAYEVLGDDAKRKKYDQFGFAGVDPNMMGGDGGFSGFSGGMSAEDIFREFASMFGGDFGGASYSSSTGGAGGGGGGINFEDIFGMGGAAGGGDIPERGDDLYYNLNLSFLESIKGCKRDIKLSRMVECSKCHGSGCVPIYISIYLLFLIYLCSLLEQRKRNVIIVMVQDMKPKALDSLQFKDLAEYVMVKEK